MNSLLQWIMLLCGAMMVHAQSYTVQGTVTDFHDKTKLKNATVVLGNYKTSTNTKGEFSISKVEGGDYTLKISHPDCDDFTKSLAVHESLNLEITLEHHAEDVGLVTLHGTLKNKGSIIIQTLDRADMDKQATENLGNLISKISGVTVLKTGNNITKPIIHGMYGSRVGILNNNVKLAEQEWGVEHAPNVDTNEFEHIDVVKGASALKYGNENLGGLVLLEPTVLPKKDTLMGRISLSGISNGRGAELSTTLAKTWKNAWYVKTGGTFKKLGDMYIPHHTLQNTGTQLNSFNFSFGNQNFKRGFDIAFSTVQQNFGIFKGAHLESPLDYYNAITYGQPFYLDNFSYDLANPKQEVSHHVAKLTAYHRFADFGKLTFQYSFQMNNRKEYDIRRGESDDLPSMDLRLITHSATLTHLLERANWSLESGINASFQDNYPNPATKARRLIPDYFRYDAGAFSIFKYKMNEKWTAEVGARYDFNRYDAYKYYDESVWNDRYASIFPQFVVSEHDSRVLARPILDYHNFSANIGLNYKHSKAFEAKLNLSKNDRAPNAAELFADGLHHSAAIMESGDMQLKKEQIYQANLNLKGELDILNGVTWELNPYLMYSKNYINQVPSGVKTTNRGVFQVWDYQQIEARIYGLDADLNVNITDKLRWNTTYSTLRGDDLSNNEPLILMMPSQLRNSLELNLSRPSNFYVRLENENVFKQNRFPIRNQNVTFIDGGQTVTKDLDFSSTPKAYTLFHIGTGMDLVKNLHFSVKFNNIFNTEYREYLNRLRYFMPELGRNIVATIKFNF